MKKKIKFQQRLARLNRLKNRKLFKYIPSQFLDTVLNDGSILFRNLTYFQRIEDNGVRGDLLEGSHLYKPKGGFEITNVTQGNVPMQTTWLTNSINPDDVFIFCLSQTHSEELYEEFECDCCLEILDPVAFTSKLTTALKNANINATQLHHAEVEYYTQEAANDFRLKDPYQIPFWKHEEYTHQDEYRHYFALGDKLETVMKAGLQLGE